MEARWVDFMTKSVSLLARGRLPGQERGALAAWRWDKEVAGSAHGPDSRARRQTILASVRREERVTVVEITDSSTVCQIPVPKEQRGYIGWECQMRKSCSDNIALSAVVACRNLVCRKRVFAGIHEAYPFRKRLRDNNECITRREVHYLGSSNEIRVVYITQPADRRCVCVYSYLETRSRLGLNSKL